MAKAHIPHFHNNDGVSKISIGVKEFMCVGATEPYDHPHVFLDMGHDTQKVCPYCSTLFVYDENLSADASEPANCLIEDEAA